MPYRRPLAAPTTSDAQNEADVNDLLKKVQQELMPSRARDIVAINTETGEFVVGETFHGACEAFADRWPHGPMYVSRVDGGPAVRMYSRS